MPAMVPLDAPVIWMTTLREPIDRLVSSFHWWREQVWARPSLHVCHGYAKSMANNMSAAHWLAHVAPDNFVARSLCGGARAWLRRSSSGRQDGHTALLTCALRRLNVFAVVMIVEFPEASARMLAARLAWRNFSPILGSASANVRAASPSTWAHDGPEQAAWLRAHANTTLLADQQLYTEAVRRLLAEY